MDVDLIRLLTDDTLTNAEAEALLRPPQNFVTLRRIPVKVRSYSLRTPNQPERTPCTMNPSEN